MDKNEILKEAFAMFRQYGVKSVSMDDIASKLAISKKTLYTHFRNKEDLVEKGIKRVFKKLFNECEGVTSRDLHPLVSISLIYYTILKELSRYKSAYFYTIDKYSAHISSMIDDQREAMMADYVQPLFTKAVEQGSFNPGVNLELFIDLHLTKIDVLYDYAVGLSPSLSIADLFRQLVVFPINGICTNQCSKFYLNRINEELVASERNDL